MELRKILGILFHIGIVTSATESYFQVDVDIASENRSWSPVITDGPHTIVDQDAFVADGVDEVHAANNNVAAILHNDRLYLAWRSSPTHFASTKTVMYIVSSGDNGATWRFEAKVSIEKDLREPYFYAVNNSLRFSFFEGGTSPTAFEPSRMWRMSLDNESGSWSPIEQWGGEGEIAWQFTFDNKDNHLYTISYAGNHYSLTQLGEINLYLNRTSDGYNWEPALDGPLYTGGICEVGFGFDLNGVIWGIGRNEDGDATGWGSRTFRLDLESGADATPEWTDDKSDPNIYESPRMFRHGEDLYLVGRTDPHGPFMSSNPLNLPPTVHHLYDLASYSLRSHGTAIWRLNRTDGKLEHVLDLPGCGDTAFPSIVRAGPHKFIIFNYSNPMDKCENWPWIQGQVSPAGTLVYMLTIEFQ